MPADQIDEITILADDDNPFQPRRIEYFDVGSIPFSKITKGKCLNSILLV